MLLFFKIGVIVTQLGLTCTMPDWKEKILALLFAVANGIIFCWK